MLPEFTIESWAVDGLIDGTVDRIEYSERKGTREAPTAEAIMADGSRKPVVIRRYADLTPEERDIESGRIAHLHTSDGLYISARVKLKITMPETMTVLRTASS